METDAHVRGVAKRSSILKAQAGAALKNNIGVAACALHPEGRVVHRGLSVHGRMLMGGLPVYLEEVAAMHAMRTANSFLGISVETQAESAAERRSGALPDGEGFGELVCEWGAGAPVCGCVQDGCRCGRNG